ncbi:hypothetical protein CHELA40_14838 [Chelatococcus asaccharovorans]|nr:hypothetical protein CHELA17_60784 [Chelatococcus asaccharovorans]CAH1680274.1 hypothetical protein CHELA40_14838 [Chelatococcus asaccharovorans]
MTASDGGTSRREIEWESDRAIALPRMRVHICLQYEYSRTRIQKFDEIKFDICVHRLFPYIWKSNYIRHKPIVPKRYVSH